LRRFLVTTSPTRAWVVKVLGDLVADDGNDERLRETLRVLLGCGGSYKMAAQELDMQQRFR
jgi:DNA-binding PucR family transcriptional regulator